MGVRLLATATLQLRHHLLQFIRPPLLFLGPVLKSWRTQTFLTLTLANSYVIRFEEDDETTKQAPDKVQIPEPHELSNTFQLQQAFSRAVDSSVTAVSISFRTYKTAQDQYIVLLQAAIKTLTTGLEVSVALREHLGLEQRLALLQSEIFVYKSLLSDGHYVFEESAKMLSQAAGVSFLIGNEKSSEFATAHLHNMQLEVLEHLL